METVWYLDEEINDPEVASLIIFQGAASIGRERLTQVLGWLDEENIQEYFENYISFLGDRRSPSQTEVMTLITAANFLQIDLEFLLSERPTLLESVRMYEDA